MVAIKKGSSPAGNKLFYADRTCLLACGACFFLTLIVSVFAFLVYNIAEAPNDNGGSDGRPFLLRKRSPPRVDVGDKAVAIPAAAGAKEETQLYLPRESIYHRGTPPEGEGEYVRLKSGSYMPAMGFGTCCRKTSTGDPLFQSVKTFLEHGGKLVDTAQAYANSDLVGKAVKWSGVHREDIWLTNKLGLDVKTRKDAVETVDRMLRNMKLSYLDLVLIHMPWNGKAISVEVWKGLIEAKKRGFVKVIGVSNFSKLEIEDLIKETGVAPEVNQIQFHPWTPKGWKNLALEWMKENGIVATAYNSLGGSRFHASSKKRWPDAVSKIATKHGVTEVQLLLRWALAKGVAVIPGATSAKHIDENLKSPKIKLTSEDFDAIENSEVPEDWWKEGKDKFAKFSSESAFEVAWMYEEP